MKSVCICGGGSLGHVVAGWLSAKGKAKVSVLTGRPHLWNNEVIVNSEGMSLVGKIDAVGSKPEFLLPKADVVILCYPGYMISQALHIIKPFLRPDAYVGSIFSSSGFFFEAFRILGHRQPLWGFQRVPFIGRIDKYGVSANPTDRPGKKSGKRSGKRSATVWLPSRWSPAARWRSLPSSFS